MLLTPLSLRCVAPSVSSDDVWWRSSTRSLLSWQAVLLYTSIRNERNCADRGAIPSTRGMLSSLAINGHRGRKKKTTIIEPAIGPWTNGCEREGVGGRTATVSGAIQTLALRMFSTFADLGFTRLAWPGARKGPNANSIIDFIIGSPSHGDCGNCKGLPHECFQRSPTFAFQNACAQKGQTPAEKTL